MIHWELCKKFKFDHTNKWYIHNPTSILENETQKLLWDFDIQMDYRISARRPDLIINKKKKRNCKIVDFAVPADHRIKLKECEKRDKYLDVVRELKKTVEYESDNYTNRDWCFWYSYQRIIKGTRGDGNKRASGNHSSIYIIENDQNTENGPRYFRRLAVTLTPVKDHQLTLM